MVNYKECSRANLVRHLEGALPPGSMSACYQGVYYEEGELGEVFREELEVFVSCCNCERVMADAYEVCEDYDPSTGVTIFYVMCEDGRTVIELPVFFIEEDSGVTLHAGGKHKNAL